jgi:hypothetical protein
LKQVRRPEQCFISLEEIDRISQQQVRQLDLQRRTHKRPRLWSPQEARAPSAPGPNRASSSSASSSASGLFRQAGRSAPSRPRRTTQRPRARTQPAFTSNEHRPRSSSRPRSRGGRSSSRGGGRSSTRRGRA